jgi:diguanylate cyclase (GGDEF)-like protein
VAVILVADDVLLSRDALTRALRDRGHEVLSVTDGHEAVERFQRDQFHAAVMDVSMPRMSGIEAAARIKSAPGRHTPVILISARSDVDSRIAALAVADDFVAKPYETNELAARLEAHLRTRRLVEEVRAARPTGASEAVLKTRERLLERLEEEWARSVRFNEPLSLLLVGPDLPDLDTATAAKFHEAVNRVLRQIDVTAHYQGAEVCALLPNTHFAGALVAATRLKRELQRISARGGPLSASMGIAFYPGREINERADLLRMAERAISRARDEGPGHICLYQHQGYIFQPE